MKQQATAGQICLFSQLIHSSGSVSLDSMKWGHTSVRQRRHGADYSLTSGNQIQILWLNVTDNADSPEAMSASSL